MSDPQLELRVTAAYGWTIDWMHREGVADADGADEIANEAVCRFLALLRRGGCIHDDRALVLGIARRVWLEQCRRRRAVRQRMQPCEIDSVVSPGTASDRESAVTLGELQSWLASHTGLREIEVRLLLAVASGGTTASAASDLGMTLPEALAMRRRIRRKFDANLVIPHALRSLL